MLSAENYTANHIEELKIRTGADPSIIERTVYAFGLLEAISLTGLPFIFKGGTSLLLLLERPKRLSTDIDIIVEPGTDIEWYITRAGSIFPFIRVEENKRVGTNAVVKRHFRFCFLSPRTEKEISILLDVVFEKNHYPRIEARPIRNPLLISKGENKSVLVPDINCILGDKLTAFAPHMTGIPFGINKEMEIIKQLFDCWTLVSEMNDYDTVAESYDNTVRIEMKYRGLEKHPRDVLLDTIESCICIIGRGAIRPLDYQSFLTGINAIQGHIFEGRLTGENAGMIACHVMYLATCLFTGQTSCRIIDDFENYRNTALKMKGSKRISYIRKADLESYSYLVESFRLLQEKGCFIDSIFYSHALHNKTGPV